MVGVYLAHRSACFEAQHSLIQSRDGTPELLIDLLDAFLQGDMPRDDQPDVAFQALGNGVEVLAGQLRFLTEIVFCRKGLQILFGRETWQNLLNS
jgi:hypothetical protein